MKAQAAAREMGYAPNAMATALGHQRHSFSRRPITAEIAWINYWEKPKALRRFREYDLYWEGAQEAAAQSGFRLREVVYGAGMTPIELEETLVERKIQGVLLPPHEAAFHPSRLEKIDWKKFSVVRFGCLNAGPAAHVVASNHIFSGMIALENILKLGYRRIGFVSSGKFAARFKTGFFMKQSELEINQRIPILHLLESEDHFSELPVLSAWLKDNRPDAILTDLAETREMLERLGYQVPRDIGLAATSILNGHADAGIDQNSREVGKAAVETLVALLNRNVRGIPEVFREVSISGKWVNGATLPSRCG